MVTEDVVEVWSFSSSISLWSMLYYLVRCLICEKYVICHIRWRSLIIIASGGLYVGVLSPNEIEWDILIYRSLWSDLGPK